MAELISQVSDLIRDSLVPARPLHFCNFFSMPALQKESERKLFSQRLKLERSWLVPFVF
jgi:hypothetical protein